MAVVDPWSSGVIFSCDYVPWLGIQIDNQEEVNVALLSILEKKVREVFYDMPKEASKLKVFLPALVADNLFLDVLLVINWLKVVEAHLDVTQLKIRVNFEKLRP